jgi:hypothetical protein
VCDHDLGANGREVSTGRRVQADESTRQALHADRSLLKQLLSFVVAGVTVGRQVKLADGVSLPVVHDDIEVAPAPLGLPGNIKPNGVPLWHPLRLLFFPVYTTYESKSLSAVNPSLQPQLFSYYG